MRQGALAALALLALTPATALAETASVTAARLTQPTTRYDHGVLGDAVEWGALDLTVSDCPGCPARHLTVTLPETRVFEDVEARVTDADGDGRTEVMVVETDLAKGASLALYGADGRRTATAFLGQTHRWLAPVGVADLDGDGNPEIAYVEKPHLDRVLVILRLRSGQFTKVARLPGVTNHRIGDSRISGGLRNCGSGAEAVLATADWSGLVAVSLQDRQPRVTPIADSATPRAFARALACRQP